MLSSEEEAEKSQAVQMILNIRGEENDEAQLGDFRVRSKKTPSINPDATTLSELIDWSDGVSEPPLTCSMTTVEVKALVSQPMVVPD